MATARTPHRLTDLIRQACQAHPVQLAYLFGSHARGTADAESDLDIAVLADAALSKDERLHLRLRLQRVIADAVGMYADRVDVVILQDVPVLLQFNVVRTGIIVLGDPATRQAVELSVERRYEDEAPYLDREAAITLDRILAHAR